LLDAHSHEALTISQGQLLTIWRSGHRERREEKTGHFKKRMILSILGACKPGQHGGMDKVSYVYLLASGPYGTLYIGVSSNLVQRISQHRTGMIEGFSKRHAVHRLVWFETHGDILEAITREKQLKKWHRSWKIRLIQSDNPQWRDLYDDICG
jgi:putative endonuclease